MISWCRSLSYAGAILLVLALAGGCAKTKVTDREELVTGPIARPACIWVHPFAATPADVPAGSALASEPDLDTTPLSGQEVAEGRALGQLIASSLVDEIQKMGLPAQVALVGSRPQVNDLVIRGSILSIKEGSAAKRIAIGFGSGASELRTLVEGYQVTPQGERKLGQGTLDSGGGKSPGAAVGVASFLATHNPAGLIISSGVKVYGEASGKSTVEGRAKATAKEVADVLKKRFQEQGWIS